MGSGVREVVLPASPMQEPCTVCACVCTAGRAGNVIKEPSVNDGPDLLLGLQKSPSGDPEYDSQVPTHE